MTEAAPRRRRVSTIRVMSAAIVTAMLVVALELVSIARPAGPLIQAAYFLIPGIVAGLFFRGWIERFIAFVLLTIFGFLAAAAVVTLLLA